MSRTTVTVPAGHLAATRRAIIAAGGRIVTSAPVSYGYSVTYAAPGVTR